MEESSTNLCDSQSRVYGNPMVSASIPVRLTLLSLLFKIPNVGVPTMLLQILQISAPAITLVPDFLTTNVDQSLMDYLDTLL